MSATSSKQADTKYHCTDFNIKTTNFSPKYSIYEFDMLPNQTNHRFYLSLHQYTGQLLKQVKKISQDFEKIFSLPCSFSAISYNPRNHLTYPFEVEIYVHPPLFTLKRIRDSFKAGVAF